MSSIFVAAVPLNYPSFPFDVKRVFFHNLDISTMIEGNV